MPEIHVLPTHLVNKIAAGEVIERPASVVKELVENALDAGATRIEVAVEDGGARLISVTDDGCGMSADDLALAFVPHATSKISGEDDLFAIATMGFRGEALASVASVSHAHLRTRRREDAAGHEIDAAGESVGAVRPCAAAPGTAVTIRDLFFNTPARRKFLRSPATELGHVSEQIARLALPHPHVAFRLCHNGRETLNLPPAETTLQRTRDLFGGELAEALLPVAPRRGAVRVAGLVGAPAAARASGKWQYFFLNGRYIRDRLLSHALREAFRGRLDPSRWPVAMIFLEIDPGEVDVNVHPTKIEVRFRDSQAVYGELLAALKETLNRAELAPDAVLARPAAPPAPSGEDHVDDDRRASLRQALADFFKSAPPRQPRLSFPEPTPHRAAPPPVVPDVTSRDQPPAPTAAEVLAPPAAPEPPLPAAEAIQLHNSYLVAACDDGLVIVDQHALHERLIYNDLKRRLADRSALTGQRMLLPQPVRVTPAESAALEAHGALLARLGIEVAPFGPGTVAVQQFPTLLAERGVAADAFLRELLDSLSDNENAEPEHMLESLLEMLACKAAVKAGDPLTHDEIVTLLARRDEADKGASCPHGRPTALRLTLRDLEKQFQRA
ncbi:MAG TPA: DNA mismatch repair endonuclease MutL [Phycisphaerales bacterium]|nr:DNA mismatch repair endonuclease MutL [Phycisphaerales bacterium]